MLTQTKRLPNDVKSLQKMVMVFQQSNQDKDALIEKQKTIVQEQKKLTQEQKTIAQQKTEDLTDKNTLIDELNKVVQKKDNQIMALEYKLKKALIAKFGRKSEQGLSLDQLGIFDEPLVIDKELEALIAKAESETYTVPAHERKKRGRPTLPDRLPREVIEYDLPAEERFCTAGHALHHIGEDRSEKLEYIPAQLKVLQTVCHKYGCRTCEDGGIKTASKPAALIPKSIVTPGLAAHVAVSKYEDHLPLYRQEKQFARLGIQLARGTMGDWLIRIGEQCEPLMLALKEHVLSGDYVQADETPVQVLKLEGKSPHSKSYIWVVRGGTVGHEGFVYEMHKTRSAQAADELLLNFKGKLQTDGYSGYNAHRSRKTITSIGCMAHIRRKFTDIVKVSKREALAFVCLEKMKALYGIESIARSEKMNTEERYALRQSKAKPLLEELKQWLDTHEKQVPPKSPIGEAITYAQNQWPCVSQYVEHGDVEIDNNLIENAIRPFALGRKNWLFMGNEAGAKASCLFYSLIETCKAHQIDPYAYLKYLFSQLPGMDKRDPESVRQLLPQFIDQGKLKGAYLNSLVETRSES